MANSFAFAREIWTVHDNELQDDYEFVFHILKECAFMNFMIIFFFIILNSE